jgi:hypothetical protein
MRMPIPLIAVLFASPTAAAAQPPLEESLPPPEAIEAMGVALERMMDALLDVRIGPLAEALNPDRPASRRDETLGDLARRNDAEFDEHMHDSVREMTDGIAEMTVRLSRLAPVIEETMEDVERRAEDAMWEGRRRYPYDN